MLNEGKSVGPKLVQSMRTANQQNQFFHEHHPPVQEYPAATIAQRPGGPPPQPSQPKKSAPGAGAQKQRGRSSVASGADWVPLAQSKRIYPDEKKDQPFAVRSLWPPPLDEQLWAQRNLTGESEQAHAR
jgi:hypothetical protein